MANPVPVQSISVGGTSGTGELISGNGWDPPMAGNLLVVFSGFSERNRTLTIPSGYTEIGDSGGGGPSLPRVTAFGKIADGTESSVLIEWSASGQWAAVLQEFDAQEVEVNQPEDFGDGGAASSVDEMASGTTSTVLGYGAALFTSLAYNAETPSATGDFEHELVVAAGGSSDLCLDVFRSDERQDSSGTYSTTASWTSSENRAAICLAAAIGETDGEKLKDYQKTKAYKVLYFGGTPAVTGKNRGQARKWIHQHSPGVFLLKTES